MDSTERGFSNPRFPSIAGSENPPSVIRSEKIISYTMKLFPEKIYPFKIHLPV